MKSLDRIVSICFQRISIAQVLEGSVRCNHMPKDVFDALAMGDLKYLTETETQEIYHYLQNGQGEFNVFRLLKKLADELLLIREDKPVCRYSQILRWRSVVRAIGEDLPICAFLADRAAKSAYSWSDFEWNPVIGHDNMQLNRIMQKGIADNHFHLFGSAPSFQLIWLKMMNNLQNPSIIMQLREIDQKKRVIRPHYAVNYREYSLEEMYFQAGVLRGALFQYLQEAGKGRSRQRHMSQVMDNTSLINKILTDKVYKQVYLQDVLLGMDVLRDETILCNHRDVIDYALKGLGRGGCNHDFEGERALLYHILLGQVNGKAIPEIILNWFYTYILIKGKFYEELVQVNEKIGFANFSQYTGRKRGILYSKEDNRRMVQHAVLGSMESRNMVSLEVRITPNGKSIDNQKMISAFDGYIKERIGKEELKRIYYVFHFPKKQDDKLEQEEGYVYRCRHYNYRQEIIKKANALVTFREKHPREAQRVLGIDACAQEIGCRPEVFGPSFRYMTSHVCEPSVLYQVKQWKISYHVGEDWLDVVDGLRAIEEAVNFLGMRNGDRLGHATVLGINVQKWYQCKDQEIILPLQDYLDNVVWLYHKLMEFDIQPAEALKGFLKGEYEKYFAQLYGKFLTRGGISDIAEKLKINESHLRFDIDTYYEAWKLRGDDPSLYSEGFYSTPDYYFQAYMENSGLANGERIRRCEEAGILMYCYHYSAEIRNKGMEPHQIAVSDKYIDGVRKVQKAMQWQIAGLGISIESNPSSNYFISTMEEYKDHPISNFFNIGLTMEEEELSSCPQLHVSINTDDKGVFNTSLENEFALMGCALEQQTDDKGRFKYSKQMVYGWLDQIRENGIQQSFLERIPE